MDSVILEDIKRMLGIAPSTTEFDIDIVSAINSAFFTLYQLGIGLHEPFVVEEDTDWSELDTTVPKQALRNYIYLKVKTVFDPPSSSFVAEAMRDRISELEFRLNIQADNGGGEVYG